MTGLASFCLVVALLAGAAWADDAPEGPAPDDTHPVLSADDGWVRGLLLGMGGLFAAAVVVGGPIVWFGVRGVVPAAATHEENPAADRH